MLLWSKIKEWYQEKKVLVYDDHPEMPSYSIEDQTAKSAKAVRNFFAFLVRHWQFLIMAILTIVGVIIAYLTLSVTKDGIIKEKPSKPREDAIQYKI